jgi:hypothetical protein
MVYDEKIHNFKIQKYHFLKGKKNCFVNVEIDHRLVNNFFFLNPSI